MDSLIVSHGYKDQTMKSEAAKEKNFKATSKFCSNQVISGNITNLFNFLKHIEEQHSTEFKKFQQVGSRKGKNHVPLKTADSRAVKRQTVLQARTGNSALTQKQFESAFCCMPVEP